jgi:hypothetical protein
MTISHMLADPLAEVSFFFFELLLFGLDFQVAPQSLLDLDGQFGFPVHS